VTGEVLKRLAAAAPAALFLDFDGTLVGIRSHPNLPRLSPPRKRILAGLSRRLFVAVISGRSLADLRRRLAIPGLACAGSHGLEIRVGDREWQHPGCVEASGLLATLALKMHARLGSLPGLVIEQKPFSFALHFRMVEPRARAAVVAELRTALAPYHGELALAEGKMVLEVRPAVPWNKGDAVRKIAKMAGVWGRHPLVYVGDDLTDEDAFAALCDMDLSIRVGKTKDSRARFQLNNVAEVWKLIGILADRVPLR
jgi:trehalose-phosphatase